MTDTTPPDSPTELGTREPNANETGPSVGGADAAAQRIRDYLRLLPDTVNLGAESAYSGAFQSDSWPHDWYPLTREDIQALLDRLADYENRLTWETNCGEHARLLDSCYNATTRAEQAEAALERVREFAADMRTWCSPHGVAADYADRLLAVVDGTEQAAEDPMEQAYRRGATRIPGDLAAEICEATNGGRPTGWPVWYDRDCEAWEATGYRYDGDEVMLPSAGNMMPMLRRDVQAEWGPLIPEGLRDEYDAARNARMAAEYAARQAGPRGGAA